MSTQPVCYQNIIDKEQISFDCSFTYTSETLRIKYNNAEKVFSVLKRTDDTFYTVLMSSLDVSTTEKQEQLLDLLCDEAQLLYLSETQQLKTFFEINQRHAIERTIDHLTPSEKDKLLLAFATEGTKGKQKHRIDPYDPQQQAVLDHLVSMNKYRSDKLLTLSVFRLTFGQYLTGELAKTSPDWPIMEVWDNLNEPIRNNIAITYLQPK